ncbi:hypothetical protein [Aeromonas veronii]|uniref:hypothetical protein n=1 Tax=Aeromonas veronii TaxID=654 RepID=UPI00331136A2|nr:hypothetical protein [Aeromonas veronii]
MQELNLIKTVNYISLDEFKNIFINQVQDGIHRIKINENSTLDILVENFNKISDCNNQLLVFFGGAISGRKNLEPPFFYGRGLSQSFGFPLISISDPTISMDKSINIGWFAGNKFINELHMLLSNILDFIARAFRCDLALIGGSAGGFCAIAVAEKLRSACKIFVWNPQTNIANYVGMFVRQYLNVAFDLCLKDELSHIEYNLLVSHLPIKSKLDANNLNNNVEMIYLQNFSDGHTHKHLAPFIVKSSSFKMKDGYLKSDYREQYVLIGDWGEGHIQPPRIIIEFVISHIIKNTQITQLVTELCKLNELNLVNVNTINLEEISAEYIF